MNPNHLAALAKKAGVSIVGRAAAIRQHVLEMPAPVVADALTYRYKTTARLAAQNRHRLEPLRRREARPATRPGQLAATTTSRHLTDYVSSSLIMLS